MTRTLNYWFFAIIFLLAAGGFGGSFQLSRVATFAAFAVAIARSRLGASDCQLIDRGLLVGLVFLLSGLLALSWTPDIYAGAGLVIAVSLGFSMLWIVARMDRSDAGIRLLVLAWCAAIAVTLPFAFYEIATGNHFLYALDPRNLGGDLGEFPFASILFGNYNDYSVFLCMGFPFLCSAMISEEGYLTRFFLGVVILLSISVIAINTSRACLFALIFYLIVFAISDIRFRKFLLVFAPTFGIYLLLYQYQFAASVFDIANLRINSTGYEDISTIQRVGIFSAGISAMIDTRGLGVGPGGFPDYMARYFPYYIPNAHNIFLEIAVNFGVAALGAFIIWICNIFWRTWKRTEGPSEFRLVVLTSIPMIPVIGLVSSQAIGFTFWWAWLASLAAVASRSPVPSQAPSTWSNTARSRRYG
jgi:O-antigen ligase